MVFLCWNIRSRAWVGKARQRATSDQTETTGCSMTTWGNKSSKTYILLGLLNTSIDFGHVSLEFIVEALELVLGNDSKTCFGVKFPLPNGG